MNKILKKLITSFTILSLFLSSCDLDSVLNDIAQGNINLNLNNLNITNDLPNEKIETNSCQHTYSNWIGSSATCEKDSTHYRTCSKCGHVETKVENAKGHSYSNTYLYDANGHYKLCVDCKKKSSEEAHSFDNGEVISILDEESDGIVKYTCTTCGYYYKDITPALGHIHNMEYHEATYDCENDGTDAYYYCNKCERYFTDEFGNNQIQEKSLYVSATGHKVSGYKLDGNKLVSSTICSTCKKDLGNPIEIEFIGFDNMNLSYYKESGDYCLVGIKVIESGDYAISYQNNYGNIEAYFVDSNLNQIEIGSYWSNCFSRKASLKANKQYYIKCNKYYSYDITITKTRAKVEYKTSEHNCSCGTIFSVEDMGQMKQFNFSGNCQFNHEYVKELDKYMFKCSKCGLCYEDNTNYHCDENCLESANHVVTLYYPEGNSYIEEIIINDEYYTGNESHSYMFEKGENSNYSYFENGVYYYASSDTSYQKCEKCGKEKKNEHIYVTMNSYFQVGYENKEYIKNSVGEYQLVSENKSINSPYINGRWTDSVEKYYYTANYQNGVMINGFERIYESSTNSCSRKVTETNLLTNQTSQYSNDWHRSTYYIYEKVGTNLKTQKLYKISYCNICGEEIQRELISDEHIICDYSVCENNTLKFYNGCAFCKEDSQALANITFALPSGMNVSGEHTNSNGITPVDFDNNNISILKLNVAESGFYNISMFENWDYNVTIYDELFTIYQDLYYSSNGQSVYLAKDKDYYIRLYVGKSYSDMTITFTKVEPSEIYDLSKYLEDSYFAVFNDKNGNKMNYYFATPDYAISNIKNDISDNNSGIQVKYVCEEENTSCYKYYCNKIVINNSKLDLEDFEYVISESYNLNHNSEFFTENATTSYETIDDITYKVETNINGYKCSKCGETTYKSTTKQYYDENNCIVKTTTNSESLNHSTGKLYLTGYNVSTYINIASSSGTYNQVSNTHFSIYYDSNGNINDQFGWYKDYCYGNYCKFDFYSTSDGISYTKEYTSTEHSCTTCKYILKNKNGTCEDGVLYVEMCESCGEIFNSNDYGINYHAETCSEYKLHKGSTSCEDGLDYICHCKICGTIIYQYENSSYSHQNTFDFYQKDEKVCCHSECSICQNNSYDFDVELNTISNVSVELFSISQNYLEYQLKVDKDIMVEINLKGLSNGSNCYLVDYSNWNYHYSINSSEGKPYSIIWKLKKDVEYHYYIIMPSSTNVGEKLYIDIIENNDSIIHDFADLGITGGDYILQYKTSYGLIGTYEHLCSYNEYNGEYYKYNNPTIYLLIEKAYYDENCKYEQESTYTFYKNSTINMIDSFTCKTYSNDNHSVSTQTISTTYDNLYDDFISDKLLNVTIQEQKEVCSKCKEVINYVTYYQYRLNNVLVGYNKIYYKVDEVTGDMYQTYDIKVRYSYDLLKYKEKITYYNKDGSVLYFTVK